MKLLVCAQEYPPRYSSGIGNVAYNVVEQLEKIGVDCTVCSPTGPDIKLGSSSMIQRYGILGLLYYWYQVVTYFRKSADNYDVAWLHYPLFIRENPFGNCLITVHETSYGHTIHKIHSLHLHIYKKICSKIEKYCLNKIDLDNATFTAVSLQTLRELRELGIGKVIHIPNGASIEIFKPSKNNKELRKKFDFSEDELILLSIGRLTETKQPYKLVEVFSLIEKEIKGMTLVMAGTGELLEKTKSLARKKGLRNVRFLGYVDNKDLPGLYACSDFFIMPSNYEGGQPTLTLAEAMASGLSCIVSDIPNLQLVVEDAQCGISVDFSNEGKAAERIISYLKEDNSRHSRNAREYAVSNLDWKLIAGRYLEEFEKVSSNEK